VLLVGLMRPQSSCSPHTIFDVMTTKLCPETRLSLHTGWQLMCTAVVLHIWVVPHHVQVICNVGEQQYCNCMATQHSCFPGKPKYCRAYSAQCLGIADCEPFGNVRLPLHHMQ